MSFSGNISRWRGTEPNALQSGRVDSYVGVNNDKTGYSLTAGSYVVRASSSQRGTIALAGVATNTAAVSSVTTTRAMLTNGSGYTTSASATDVPVMLDLTSATVVTATKGDAPDSSFGQYDLVEFF